MIQEALGAINNTTLARDAVEYAYRHGVTVIASAADEAAQHNNWPSSLPHVVMVNSVTQYSEFADLPDPLPPDFTEQPTSYLKFNGCTNFYAKMTVAIPSVSCSSDATGRGRGDRRADLLGGARRARPRQARPASRTASASAGGDPAR